MKVDPDHCGGCGDDAGSHVCAVGQLCGNGTCVTECAADQIACGASCIDPTSSNAFCGATPGCGQLDAGTAGTACEVESACVEGACVALCGEGRVRCGDACIDPATDEQHCGATLGCGERGGDAGATCSICWDGACAHMVFVTSTTYPTSFGGLAQADAACQARAVAGGLTGTFKAWLSDNVESPNTRFERAATSYRRPDGVRVAVSYAALTSGSLEAPISVTELGTPFGSNPFVFTGTGADGNKVPNPGGGALDANCNGWTSTAGPPWAGVGDPESTDASWTYALARGINYCSGTSASRLYCVQQ